MVGSKIWAGLLSPIRHWVLQECGVTGKFLSVSARTSISLLECTSKITWSFFCADVRSKHVETVMANSSRPSQFSKFGTSSHVLHMVLCKTDHASRNDRIVFFVFFWF